LARGIADEEGAAMTLVTHDEAPLAIPVARGDLVDNYSGPAHY
jgi:hypothetical protein